MRILYDKTNKRNREQMDSDRQTEGLTSVQGPQAEVGLPVELFYTCWPCGGVENVPLLVPGSLVMYGQLTLHIQVRLGCQREGGGDIQVKQQDNSENIDTHTSTWSLGLVQPLLGAGCQ